jgi:hypothetical protein
MQQRLERLTAAQSLKGNTFLQMGGSNFIWRKPSTESGISGKPQAAAALGIAVAAGLSGCD